VAEGTGMGHTPLADALGADRPNHGRLAASGP
jgi:hypothetical protein